MKYVFMLQIISKIQIFLFWKDGWTCQIYYWEYLKWANRISENADTSGHGDHLVKLKEMAKNKYLAHCTKNSPLLSFFYSFKIKYQFLIPVDWGFICLNWNIHGPISPNSQFGWAFHTIYVFFSYFTRFVLFLFRSGI